MSGFTEADMYEPIKNFFVGMGYEVYGEVKGCDIAMIKNGELTIIEMKKHFNMQLVFQILERQKITSQVYAAIPNPRRNRETSGQFSKIKKIAGALAFGLITVDMDSAVKSIDLVAFPTVLETSAQERTRGPRKAAVLKESGGRTLDLNEGGSAKKKIVTAYRERAVAAACALKIFDGATTDELRRAVGMNGLGDIFRKNYYGWFEKRGEKSIGLTKSGENALFDEDFRPLTEFYLEKFGGKNEG